METVRLEAKRLPCDVPELGLAAGALWFLIEQGPDAGAYVVVKLSPASVETLRRYLVDP